jgi:hypothetical protein
MRVAWLLLLMTSGCSLAVETSDLSGGTRDATPQNCDTDFCETETRVLKLASISPCSRETTDKLGCRARIAEACRALDACCFHGGYGPLDFPNADEATVVCFTEQTYTAPVSELTTASAKCLASALASRDCDAAAHLSASKRGDGTAVLQSVSGDSATLIGIDADFLDVATIPWADLTTLDPGCTLANIDKQACTTAVQRKCVNDGSTAGYGPVASTATTATIACYF